MRKFESLVGDPWEIIRKMGAKGMLKWMTDKHYLRLMYYVKIREPLDLINPKTFNEKLQWLKLYDRKPIYTKVVDKYQVRSIVADRIGEKHLIPLLGVWDSPEDIDFEKLPDRFVLKCNHDSGTVVICSDKNKLDFNTTKIFLRKKMNRNFYYGGREWPYKNIKRKIICEQYMEDSSGGLKDYKIYCFSGTPKIIMIASDRFSNKQTHFDYFDINFQWLDLEWGNPRSKVPPKKPECFDQMIDIATKLSVGFPEIRVDLYEINGSIYFGEMTLFDGSGFQKITPQKWDYILGSWIQLPNKEI